MLAFCLFLLLVGSPNLAAQINVTTAHQDIPPTICSGTGCVYRTGQNLSENTLVCCTIADTNFGLYCSYETLDGQVYAQPLVVTNVKWNGTLTTVVYVATMNGSLYAFNGAPTANNCPTGQLAKASLLETGESAPPCNTLGGTNCQVFAPTVGILGTPVIKTTTLSDGSTGGTIYVRRQK